MASSNNRQKGAYRGSHFASNVNGDDQYEVDKTQFDYDLHDFNLDDDSFTDQTELIDRSYYDTEQGRTQLVDPFSDQYVDTVPDTPSSSRAVPSGAVAAAGAGGMAYDDGEYVADPRYATTSASYGSQQYAPAADANARQAARGYDRPYAQTQQLPVQPSSGMGDIPSSDNPPRRRSGRGTVIAAVFLLVAGVALLLVAGHFFLTSQHEYQVGIDEYSEIAETSVMEDSVSSLPVVDFSALQAQNPEIVGWVQIPGTSVNYPVTRHADNDYYLDHTFLGTYNLAGSIFMDYRSNPDLSDRTTVLYGHHLKNGAMFAKVSDYSDQAAFDQIGNVYYISADGKVHVLTPLCCMVVAGTEVDVLQFSFADEAAFTRYLQTLITRSRAFSTTATAEGVQHVYLLSTCSYERDNDRTILVCVDWETQGAPIADATGDLENIQEAAGIAVNEGDAGVDWH